MAYLISEEAQDLLQDVKNFCDKEVVEQCKAYDVSGEWPKEIYDKAIEQGYQALEVPEEFGGPGLSRVDVAALIEQMAIADAGFATTISASGLGMKPVLIAGSKELKQRACDLILEGGFGAFCLTEPGAGSDAGAGKTTAVKDGDEYVLNGRKMLYHKRRHCFFLLCNSHDRQDKRCQRNVHVLRRKKALRA